MKTTWGVLFVLVLLVLAGGCATAPEDLAATTGRDAHDACLSRTVETPGPGQGGMQHAADPVVCKGFTVLGFRAQRDEHGMVFVIGEVMNVGMATKGVELEVVLRDREDRALAVDSFCPAGRHSIAPKSTQPFAVSLGRHDGGVRAELRIVRTFYTMDTLGIAALPR